MKAISLDLDWGSGGEAAVARVDGQGAADRRCPRRFPEELVAPVSAEGGLPWVLLGIPVRRLEWLGHELFRLVDMALKGVSIQLYPSSRAVRWGHGLAERLVRKAWAPEGRVLEMYPGAPCSRAPG